MTESKETIGHRLRQLRLSRKITIENAAQATRIRVQYLQALEADNYSAMASAAQGRGFLRMYADYLGLDLDSATQELRETGEAPAPTESVEPVKDNPAETIPEASSIPSGEEKPAVRPFWSRLLKRSAPGSTMETVPEIRTEVQTSQIEETANPVESAGRTEDKKKESIPDQPEAVTQPPVSRAETPPDLEVTQPHSTTNETEDPHPGLLARLFSGLKIRQEKTTQPADEAHPSAEPVEEPPDLPDASDEGDLTREAPQVKSSAELFAELGGLLRERRELLNLTREEIERHMHLRAHYMLALEKGDFNGLPTAVQTRGMLNNYASFLNLDVDAMLLRYADVLQARHREQHPLPPGARGRPAPSAPTTIPPLRGFAVADLMAIGLVLVLIVFSVWGVETVIQKGSQVKATAPAMVDILLQATALPPPGTLVPTSGLLDLDGLTATLQPLETPAGLPVIPEGVNVQLNIIAVERTYLRVIVDGEVVFEGRVTPGNAYPFEAEIQIEILAGNGAALRIIYNQRDVGLLGKYGEVVNLIYLRSDVITPTATIGPSPTIAPSSTPVPSITPSFTPTRTRLP